MNRKVFLITIYYIIGTIGGLYFKNIIPFLSSFLAIHFIIFKNNKKKLLIAIIFVVGLLRAYGVNLYTSSVRNVESFNIVGNIEKVTNKSNTSIIEINANLINGKRALFTTKMRAYVKNDKTLNVGDKVYIEGTKKVSSYARNEGLFDYNKYLYSKELYAFIDAEKIVRQKDGIRNYFLRFISSIRDSIRQTFYEYLPESNAGILAALVIGEKANLDDDITATFSDAGLSHIIAISGMHTVYVAYIALLFKHFIGKRKSYMLVIIILFLFCNLTNNTESVYRACIMLSIFYLSKIMYRKSDSLSNLFISTILGLVRNPFCIYSPGFILSTAGTFGIITVYEQQSSKSESKIKAYIKDQIKLGLAANIILIPIVAKMYNRISLTFFISSPVINFFMGILMPVIFSFSIIGIFNKIIPSIFIKIIAMLTNFLTEILLWLAKIFQKISILNIQVTTPWLITIIAYYLVVFLLFNYRRNKSNNTKRIIKCVIGIYLCICIVINIGTIFDRSLTIYFVDVGQGDCTLIRTPYNHAILIDGGGSEDGKDDTVGDKIVIPFLLNKHIKKIDYIIVSHFDSDHVGGLLTVMEKIKVRNVIISRQGENSANYERFKKIVKSKKINVIVVEQGQRISIEEGIYFDILWPEKELISDNILNNNSIVCKLHYNNFSMLFTGDIEAKAEEKLISSYKDRKILFNSTCLKAGHHGSKTSSTEEFINLVKPEYVLIGVGINNKFGHPNDDVIERFKHIRCRDIPNR